MSKQPKPTIHFNAHAANAHVLHLTNAALRIGLPINTVWSLILEFGSQAAPILTDVITAFAGGFDWSKLGNLLTTDGPLVIALAERIAAALGLAIDPPPAIP